MLTHMLPYQLFLENPEEDAPVGTVIPDLIRNHLLGHLAFVSIL